MRMRFICSKQRGISPIPSPAELSIVTGFLTPVLVGHDAGGNVLNAFDNPEDIRRIREEWNVALSD